ncbi:MAG: VWA domain-containing protein, partial [Methanosarcinaceae archaeon]
MRSVLKAILLVTMLIMSAGSALALELEITADQGQSTVGEATAILAMVTDNSTPVNNTLVNFSTSMGDLSATSVYTNSSGMACIWVNSTISGLVTINATANSTSNNTNISFVAAPTDSILINASPVSEEVGTIMGVYLTANDGYGNTNTSANMSIEIIVTDLLGNVKDMSTTIYHTPYTQTNISIDQENITFTDSTTALSNIYMRFNSTLGGNITLNIGVGNVSNTTSLYYTPASPHSITIVYDDEYTVNTTSDITVSVSDRFRNPVPNATVVFNATPPADTDYNSPLEYNSLDLDPRSNTTHIDGIAYASFITDKRAGDNTVNISVLNTTIHTDITIVGIADQIDELLLSQTPNYCNANNGDAYRLSAQTADQFLNPVLPGGFPIKEQILFISSGSGSTLIPLNEYGIATTRAGPTPYVENITVTANYKNESGYTNVTNTTSLEFFAGDLASFRLYANPDIVLTQNQSGNHNATLYLTALDEWGHGLPSINITLNNTNPSLGTLSISGINATNLINATTNSNGRLYATFISNNTEGNATLVASNGLLNISTIVEVDKDPFMCAYVTAEPETVNSGDTVNVTTIISVEGELPISRAAATAMLVLDRSGSMDPDSYAGTPLDVVLVLDRSGSMEYLGSSPEQPMTDAKTAAETFMDSLVSNAQVGVVSFASSSTVDQGLLSLNSSDNRASLMDTIDAITATGSTAMGDGMADANTLLINGRGDARKIMIVLTDGVCNTGSDTDGTTAISTANSNGIKIYTIGLGSAEYIDESMLQRVASETGGEYFNAPTSSELQAVYSSIAQDISDYDITEVEYGTEGFTSYNYESHGTFEITHANAPYVLIYDAWDIDSTSENCYVSVNGIYVYEIPVTGDGIWDSFECDITSYVQNGSNVVGFYDPNNWPNAVKNVKVLADNITMAEYSSQVDLVSSNPYNCTFNTSYYVYEDTFTINDTLNDLKVYLDWENSTTVMNLDLISPTGLEYGANGNSTGYYFDERRVHLIDVRSPQADTYLISSDADSSFTDETYFYVTSDLNDAGDEASSLLRWELPDAPTHNATINSVTMYLHGMVEPSGGWDADTDNRAIDVYDMDTSYNTTPNWNHNDSMGTWSSGGFSNADYNSSYSIDSVSLSSSIEDDVVEFNITCATWDSDRTPDWGENCNIVLVGSGYDGTDANPSIDRFASVETNTEDHHYSLNGWRPLVTINYSISEDTYEYIWIDPLSYTYPDTDTGIVEIGNWTVRVTGNSEVEPFNVGTYIDKKSATKLASSSFISSFDESNGDRAGLILYSSDYVVNSSTQTSYVRNASEWVSYFTVNNGASYTIDLSWNDSSDLNMFLYEGTEVMNSSTGSSQSESLSSSLSGGIDYRIEVSKVSGQINDTQFMINVSSSPLHMAVCAYYDSNSGGVPRYRLWDIDEWDDEDSANLVGANIRQITMESSSSRDEIIMGTVDDQMDANFQILSDSTWNTVQEFSTSLDSYSTRGFDIAYESTSDDALVVYLDKSIDDGVPRYRIWDGSSWSGDGAVDGTNPGAGDIRWIELASNPLSDEMVLVTLDDSRDIRAQVWDGSNWGNTLSITNDARATGYRCFDVAYEQGSGDAMIVWSDTDGYVHSCIWDGSAWGTENDLYTFDSSHKVYWIKMASDVNSNNIVMGDENRDKDICVSVWNGSSWSSRVQVETDCYEYSKRIFDVAFETLSGEAIIVWGDSTTTPKYMTWNGSWNTESSATDLTGSGYTRWVQLRPDPSSNEIFLMTSDGDNDINIQQWDGSQWGLRSEVESSSSKDYENFDLVYQKYEESSTQALVNWKEWRATVTSSLENDPLSHLESAIDAMTAEGLTAIDEGMYEANNELSSVSDNSTMVLMTDGIDNAGYHSLINQAERARDQNTVIHTIGFGSSESEVDPVLSEIANITGGDYFFAPNSSVLENIFEGIAADMTNFSAEGPTLSIHVPHNYITNLSLATANYVSNSTNSTIGNITVFPAPISPSTANAEPDITIIGDRTQLLWQLPNMEPGEKWGVWYQLKVQGAGSVPLILPTSSINYTDVNGTMVDVR